MELIYKRADITDIELLTTTRIEVLRAANNLSNEIDMTEVENQSYEYYKRALKDGSHTAYLVFDGAIFVGAGGVSYFQVMPTYHNPSGCKAYIMNMYTKPEYRRKGIANNTLKLLGEKTFQFSPVEWQNIHRKLFEGVFNHAGKIRDYNITKKEWILKGNTVMYASYDSIRATLDYDFSQEKEFSYNGLSIEEAVRHIAKFTSGIWQIHPFGEGNTRSTAVFIIKYLKTFGFNVSNETFAENSWYFRNALVRANYNDLQNGIHATTKYLEMFFENLLMNAGHELKNRYMHIDFDKQSVIQSATSNDSKCKICTLEELAIIQELKRNPAITQRELANAIGKSERTVKTRTVEMQEKGLIIREC